MRKITQIVLALVLLFAAFNIWNIKKDVVNLQEEMIQRDLDIAHFVSKGFSAVHEMNQRSKLESKALIESVSKGAIEYTNTMLDLQSDQVNRVYKDTYFSLVSIEGLVEKWGQYGSAGEYEWMIGGTGVVLNNQGLILTAGHMLNLDMGRVKDIRVRMADGSILEILDSSYLNLESGEVDLGIIKVDFPKGCRKYTPISLGNLTDLNFGQEMIVIGNPHGYEHSVTKGILSRLCHEGFREGRKQFYIQTDAPVNGGNSGGPVFGLDGRCYGICSWGVLNSDGLSFFVPVNVIKRTIPILIKKMYEDI